MTSFTWRGDDCPPNWERVGQIDVADPADTARARDRGLRIGRIYEGGSGSVAEPCAADVYREREKQLSSNYIAGGATISADQMYRYLLWREWRGTHDRKNWRWFGAKDGAGKEVGEPRACVFIMLNPSTADGEVDDPTIRKCVGFAKLWHYERLEVVNLFAYRATDPKEVLRLKHGDDPVGHQNQEYFDQIIDRAGIIICAWGAHGAHLGQDETALGWLGHKPRFALSLTKDGHPRHPLYVPYATSPIRFRP